MVLREPAFLIDFPTDPYRLAALIFMGTCLVVSGVLTGYRISRWFGIDPGIGCIGGIVAGVAGLLAFLG